ncbi:ribonuclease HII [Paludifilum halophilum]|uniref:Ribonuclease HII n=1 Tax=Paludifilum halophilum TaxID=1642702 RepID=A0A235B2I5_9BACL|nr:ribonuclease HII [Paludifilum halophilum]OYD06461.1 ribonuclease HII [Paludifilum halophilum]
MRVKGTIREIEARLSAETEITDEWIQELLQDSRAGVKKLARSYLKKRERIRREEERVQRMWDFERTYREQGYRWVAGLDEAGRGPLAGPVVAAAVIFPEDFDASGLNDSKQLTPEERLTLRRRIEEGALGTGVGIVDTRFIDQHNILQATYEAMRRAVAQLDPSPDLLLLDAVKLPGVDLPQHAIVKGDTLSHSIAAASILAKTIRDEWMIQAAERYPGYGFEHHMGYGTQEHLEALEKQGPCPLHRRSFSPVGDRIPGKEGVTGS